MAASEIRMASLEVQQKELEMSILQRERAQIENENRLSNLALDLMKLDISVQRLLQELEQGSQTRRNEIREIDNAITRLELILELESKIISDCDGIILGISVQPGQVTSLLKQGGAIEIEMDLERDPSAFSGFKWTSKGPEKHFTAGTTTSVRITIERRAPITYLLPILGSWFTGEKDAKVPKI